MSFPFRISFPLELSLIDEIVEIQFGCSFFPFSGGAFLALALQCPVYANGQSLFSGRATALLRSRGSTLEKAKLRCHEM